MSTGLEHLRGWIGRTDECVDTITPGLIQRFNATLGGAAASPPGLAPPAIHWCLAPPAVSAEQTGPDGHPATGGFLPPVPLPRRMWAGGSLQFHDDLLPADEVFRSSRIAEVMEKSGRSGRLVFVTVEHALSTRRGLAIAERQDIVYREPSGGGPQPPAPAPNGDFRAADHSETIEASTLLLFRYSALTFNGHRIHYDRDYARDVEGYAGLVVQGPLQATLMLHLAVRLADGRMPRRFTFRGLSPLTDGAPFTVNAAEEATGFDLWCANTANVRTMSARAVW